MAALDLFGAAAGAAIRDMLAARRVELVTVGRDLWKPGTATSSSGAPSRSRRMSWWLPELSGPHLHGPPADGDGYLPVDAYGRVPGVACV